MCIYEKNRRARARKKAQQERTNQQSSWSAS
jgi:hypothetical protein